MCATVKNPFDIASEKNMQNAKIANFQHIFYASILDED